MSDSSTGYEGTRLYPDRPHQARVYNSLPGRYSHYLQSSARGLGGKVICCLTCADTSVAIRTGGRQQALESARRARGRP